MSINILHIYIYIYWWDPQKSGLPSKNFFFMSGSSLKMSPRVSGRYLKVLVMLESSNVFFFREKETKNKQRETTNKIRRYSVFAVFPPFFARQKMQNNQKNRKKRTIIWEVPSFVRGEKTQITRKKTTCNIFWEVLFLLAFLCFPLYVQYIFFYRCCIFQWLFSFLHHNLAIVLFKACPITKVCFWTVKKQKTRIWISWLHPRKLTWNLNISPLKGETSTNHNFLGSMLVFKTANHQNIGFQGSSLLIFHQQLPPPLVPHHRSPLAPTNQSPVRDAKVVKPCQNHSRSVS